MLQKLLKKRKTLTASHILTVLFLVFIVYVGLAALPEFLFNTGGAVYWKTGPQHYIRTVNDQYHGMLSTEKGKALLQNKGTYINLNGLMAKLMGQPMMNERVTLKNGHLSSVFPTARDDAEIASTAENLIRLHQAQAARGKQFLFILAPSKISKYEDLLPTGYTDTTNATADTLLSLLDQAGVPYLDLREKLHEDGMTNAASFFTTDHHWTPQTGFWAYGKILETLEEMGAVSTLDPFYADSSNYEFVTYENSFLGSAGKRTGKYFAGLDDSCLIVPKFDTNLSVTIPDQNVALTGRYEDVSYADKEEDYSDPDFFNFTVYGLYGWGDQALTQWRNEQAPENTRMMLIGDSFGNIPFSLLTLYASSCDELDMRTYKEDFGKHFRQYDPDTVILLVNTDQAVSENTQYPYFPE